MTKEERINKERERLTALFADLDANQLQAAAGLISSAAFLAVSLEDLEAEINANGYIDSYTNGASQAGEKISAAVQAYATLNAKYQSTIQKLLKIVPPAAKKPKPKSTEEIAAEKAEAEERERRDLVFKMQQQRDADFLAACRKGEATNDTYKEFCAAWEREHAAD